MNKEGTETKLKLPLKLPHCDICGDVAHYDAKSTLGPWGYMCESCFAKHGVGLGVGLGQRLVEEM